MVCGNGLKTHVETEVAWEHVGAFQNRDQTACDFPGEPLPEGNYSGQTDEQQSVALRVGPLYDPPKSTGWSQITSFAFTTSVECTPPAPVATDRWRIDATDDFYIPIHSDGTFSATHSGPIPGASPAVRTSRAPTSSAAGSTAPEMPPGRFGLAELSYVADGVRYTCAGRGTRGRHA